MAVGRFPDEKSEIIKKKDNILRYYSTELADKPGSLKQYVGAVDNTDELLRKIEAAKVEVSAFSTEFDESGLERAKLDMSNIDLRYTKLRFEVEIFKLIHKLDMSRMKMEETIQGQDQLIVSKQLKITEDINTIKENLNGLRGKLAGLNQGNLKAFGNEIKPTREKVNKVLNDARKLITNTEPAHRMAAYKEKIKTYKLTIQRYRRQNEDRKEAQQELTKKTKLRKEVLTVLKNQYQKNIEFLRKNHGNETIAAKNLLIKNYVEEINKREKTYQDIVNVRKLTSNLVKECREEIKKNTRYFWQRKRPTTDLPPQIGVEPDAIPLEDFQPIDEPLPEAPLAAPQKPPELDFIGKKKDIVAISDRFQGLEGTVTSLIQQIESLAGMSNKDAIAIKELEDKLAACRFLQEKLELYHRYLQTYRADNPRILIAEKLIERLTSALARLDSYQDTPQKVTYISDFRTIIENENVEIQRDELGPGFEFVGNNLKSTDDFDGKDRVSKGVNSLMVPNLDDRGEINPNIPKISKDFVSVHKIRKADDSFVSEFKYTKADLMQLSSDDRFKLAIRETYDFIQSIKDRSQPMMIRGDLPPDFVKAVVDYCATRNQKCINTVDSYKASPKSIKQTTDTLKRLDGVIFGQAVTLAKPDAELSYELKRVGVTEKTIAPHRH